MNDITHNTLQGIKQEALVHLSDSEKLLSEYGRYAETLEEMIDKLSLTLSDEVMESYEKLKQEFEHVQQKITRETAWFDELYSLVNSLPSTNELSEEDAQQFISTYKALRDKKLSQA